MNIKKIIREAIEEEDPWQWAHDTPSAEINLNKDNVYVGMRVKIHSDSHFYGYPKDTNNPKDIIGVIEDLEYSLDYPILVKWRNGNTNCYNYEDLEIIYDGINDNNINEQEDDGWDWAREIPAANEPLTKKNAKAGLTVRIRKGSEYYGDNDGGNPKDVNGVISSIDDEYNFIYVRWPEFGINAYRYYDLEIVHENINVSKTE